MVLVSVIIVNWNAGQLLVDCVHSLQTVDLPPWLRLELIVVDNGSTDDSLKRLAGSKGIRMVTNEGNCGFAKACNQGALMSTGDMLLFFNPDCVLSPGSLEACVAALSGDARVGAAGIALSDDRQHTARSCHRFPSPRHFIGRATGLARLLPATFESAMTSWDHDADRDVDHIIGAFYLVRAELFRRLGGFDERFFVYLEDLDLSLRIHQAGYRIRFVAHPRSYHKGGGTSEKAKAARLFFSTRSRILYAFKHFSGPAAWLHLLVTLALEPLCRLGELLARRRFVEIGEMLRGFGMLLRSLPATLRQARRS